MTENKPQTKPGIKPDISPQPSGSGAKTPATQSDAAAQPAPEAGGRGGLDPTRFGDWEKNGRCVDF